MTFAFGVRRSDQALPLNPLVCDYFLGVATEMGTLG